MNKKKLLFVAKFIAIYAIFTIPVLIGGIVLYRFIAPFGLRVGYDFNISQNAELFGRIRDVDRTSSVDISGTTVSFKDKFTITKERVEFSIVPLTTEASEVKIRIKTNEKDPIPSTLIQVRDFYSNQNDNFLLKNDVVSRLGNPSFDYAGFNVWSFNDSIKTREDLDRKIIQLTSSSTSLAVCMLDSEMYTDPNFEGSQLYDLPKVYPVALRGTHVFYVYVGEDGIMQFGLSKRDLNWYSGTDEMNIEVKKRGKLIKQYELNDDGIYDGQTGRIGTLEQEQKIELDKLEKGVYEIDVNTTEDVLITKINSRHKKLVIGRDIFAANSGIYGNFEKNIRLYTFAPRVFMSFYHDTGKNPIVINGTKYIPEKLQNFESVELKDGQQNSVEIELADLRVSSKDFYAFEAEGYFKPSVFENLNCLTYAEDVMRKQDLLVSKKANVTKLEDGTYEIKFPFHKKYIGPEGRMYVTLYNPGLGVDEKRIEVEHLSIELIKD